MKKFFAKLKELANKLVNKVKDVVAKVKEWFADDDNKVQAIITGACCITAATGFYVGYKTGIIKDRRSDDVQTAIKWYNDPESKMLRTGQFHQMFISDSPIKSATCINDASSVYEFEDSNMFAQTRSIIGKPAKTLSDYGNVGAEFINAGYSADLPVYHAALSLGGGTGVTYFDF